MRNMPRLGVAPVRLLSCLLFLAATAVAHTHADQAAEDVHMDLEEQEPAEKSTAGVWQEHEVDGELRRKLQVAAPGYWSTDGNKIVDSNGNPVYFSGLNWGGFDAANCVFDGLWPGTGRTYQSHLGQMAAAGFNLIRLPFAGSCVQPGVVPVATGIDYTVNPDLQGLTSLEVMKKVVQAAGEVGIRIILDYHRITPTSATGDYEEGLWFSEKYPVTYWLRTWRLVATTFANDTTVVGVDLFNEPHQSFDEGGHEGPFWTDNMTDPLNWRAAAMRAGNLIHTIEPNWLICVQGMWNEAWWAGNLKAIRNYPLELKVPNKLVYSIHDYGPIVSPQPWFEVADFPTNLPAFWDSMWGFAHDENIAPIWIGEFGTKYNTTYMDQFSADPVAVRNWKELQWLQAFVAYVDAKDLVWTWFTWGPNSRDTGGILMEDWTTMNSGKVAAIQGIQYPLFSLLPTSNDTTPALAPPAAVLAPIGNQYATPPPMEASPSPPPGNGARPALAIGMQPVSSILAAVGLAAFLLLPVRI